MQRETTLVARNRTKIKDDPKSLQQILKMIDASARIVLHNTLLDWDDVESINVALDESIVTDLTALDHA